jgi:hypothetical protein
MEKVPTLHHIDFTESERKFLCEIINRYGSGQHPIADEQTIDGFTISYVKDIINRDKFKNNLSNLTPYAKELYTTILTKL